MIDYQLYLASASARRRTLLDQLGIQYTVMVPDIDERIIESEIPKDYTQRVAIDKARQIERVIIDEKLPRLPILAADTTVALGNEIFGKPQDKADALRMLNSLSGRKHQVYTSICLIAERKARSHTQVSEVEFRELSANEIERYWNSEEPLDKAGSYAIQGFGATFIKHISGSYSGVMGLPLYELVQLINNNQP